MRNYTYCWYFGAWNIYHIILIGSCRIVHFWFYSLYCWFHQKPYIIELALIETMNIANSVYDHHSHRQLVTIASSSRFLRSENNIWPSWRIFVTLPWGCIWRSTTLPVAWNSSLMHSCWRCNWFEPVGFFFINQW
jgi:hypothetical protein